MVKVKQNQTDCGIEAVIDYALKNSDKLFILGYLCSFIKLYCTISPYFLNKVICLQPLVLTSN